MGSGTNAEGVTGTPVIESGTLELVYSLVVIEDGVESAADTVTITIANRPTANAGPDQTAAFNTAVTLDGGGSHNYADTATGLV